VITSRRMLLALWVISTARGHAHGHASVSEPAPRSNYVHSELARCLHFLRRSLIRHRNTHGEPAHSVSARTLGRTCRIKAILIAIVMMCMADAEQLRITVYDKAKLPQEVSEAVVDNLHRIFRVSGIDIEWVAGVPTAFEASLMIYEPSRTDHEQELACHARRDIALDILPFAPPGVKKQVLGLAQPLARTGLNVRVFDNRIREASQREGGAHAIVLAHAIAHEIGHVLLRSKGHARRGLMSDVWTAHEYEWMSKGVMFFASDESRRMRMTLSSVGCSAVALIPHAAQVPPHLATPSTSIPTKP
jgi:hypothetical protein